MVGFSFSTFGLALLLSQMSVTPPPPPRTHVMCLPDKTDYGWYSPPLTTWHIAFSTAHTAFHMGLLSLICSGVSCLSGPKNIMGLPSLVLSDPAGSDRMDPVGNGGQPISIQSAFLTKTIENVCSTVSVYSSAIFFVKLSNHSVNSIIIPAIMYILKNVIKSISVSIYIYIYTPRNPNNHFSLICSHVMYVAGGGEWGSSDE